MTSKYIAWVLGVILVLVLGTVAFFWKSQNKAALAPVTSNEVTKTAGEASVTPTPTNESSVMETAPTSDASITDITKNIEADMSFDQTAIDKDASAEMSSLEEGNAVINDLGQTYDESKY